ncbi:MAG: FAD:protein FMN transferase [Sporolactobacillus sp.]
MDADIVTEGLAAPEAGWVFQTFCAAERRFSRFLPTSELSRLNNRSGQWSTASAAFCELLYESMRFASETNGLFSPFLGRLLEEAGYSRTFSLIGKGCVQPGRPPTHTAGNFTFDMSARKLQVGGALQLDFGGIAKGWTVQQCTQVLKNRGCTCGLISAGGDLALWQPGKRCEAVTVSHPFATDRTVALLNVRGTAGMATSSIIRRSWRCNSRRVHHILDPRSGRPASSDLIQATVIGPALLPCEVYAKCLIVLGSKEGADLLAQCRPQLAALIIGKDGSVQLLGDWHEHDVSMVADPLIFTPSERRFIDEF